MNELNLSIENVDPVVIWGANNEYFEIFKKHFPKIKIVARGNEVKVLGDDKELNLFSQKFQEIINHVDKFQTLTVSNLEQLLGTSIQVIADPENAVAKSGAGAEAIVFGPNGIVVKARTANQRKMVDSISKNDIIFAIGPAGTGKTYTAVALAVRALKNKEIKRIILTRPAVEAGENLGFLPGDLKEKIDPYLRPLYDALDDMIPADKLKVFLENRTIEIAPLAFMRGRTLDNCFVILDEAQNATDLQLKMFLTRMGPTAKFIVTGDVTQIDLPRKQQSGLNTALRILGEIKGIEIIYLNGDDVVRHKLVKNILRAYGDIQ
ncbi:MAG: phosphate starvation-inducible protein PhoH [Sphingobacteriales bacterium 17-39-43]|uniref:PhoH family protein n=1 Tax=Daejeonella sp. TaxID=2805397 RepID=UPI000BC5D12B|nr:PhoH family protein [Daejeonella sp.]OYY02355.1 MAG: phosphate starvation-inducible protein PhoH [Sphingobacteriia bacterium 35-40-5]OYZ32928.1 MAG: phosphate starvation-inducible protein PhoH [Sphingobacteriales bacterium 16-39-50]OZA26338.1 MAG: phosphate starvation-inducible protein PhoH [Sphingobacteriales bacterium 17-39-43]HQS06861.1 PhoH family protein [Daejeonella sp.]HQS51674.1 PhoH family protein [Daejeonella sp.]